MRRAAANLCAPCGSEVAHVSERVWLGTRRTTDQPRVRARTPERECVRGARPRAMAMTRLESMVDDERAGAVAVAGGEGRESELNEWARCSTSQQYPPRISSTRRRKPSHLRHGLPVRRPMRSFAPKGAGHSLVWPACPDRRPATDPMTASLRADALSTPPALTRCSVDAS